MTKTLVWKDLSEQQIENIKHPHPKKGFTGRDLLAQYNGISNQTDPKSEIELDLYVHVVQFGQSLLLNNTKLSGLFSIVKEVHLQSVRDRLTIQRSFDVFKELILSHSVQRPPFSTGLFSYPEMRRIIDWMIESYFRHYKLYQYVYTDRMTLSALAFHPRESLEYPPLKLPPLSEAINEARHQEQVEEEERQRAKATAEAAAEAAEIEERQRLERLREEYKASVPEEIREQVEAVLAKEVALLKATLESKFLAQQQATLDRIAVLEALKPSPGTVAAAAKK